MQKIRQMPIQKRAEENAKFLLRRFFKYIQGDYRDRTRSFTWMAQTYLKSEFSANELKSHFQPVKLRKQTGMEKKKVKNGSIKSSDDESQDSESDTTPDTHETTSQQREIPSTVMESNVKSEQGEITSTGERRGTLQSAAPRDLLLAGEVQQTVFVPSPDHP